MATLVVVLLLTLLLGATSVASAQWDATDVASIGDIQATKATHALKLPAASGQQVFVLNGYNKPLPGNCNIGGGGYDHCAHQARGFDFWPSGSGGWVDDLIVAPIAGTIEYYDQSPAAGPCMGLRIGGTTIYNVTLCHFSEMRPGLQIGSSVQQGEVLGLRSTGWIHMSVDDRYAYPKERSGVAYSGALSLEGGSYPEADPVVYDQYQYTQFTSTNALSSATPACKTYDGDLGACTAHSMYNPNRPDNTQDCAYYSGSSSAIQCPNSCRPRGTANHNAGCTGYQVIVSPPCSTWDGDLQGCTDHSMYNPNRADLTQDCAYYSGSHCSDKCRPRGTPATQAGCSH